MRNQSEFSYRRRINRVVAHVQAHLAADLDSHLLADVAGYFTAGGGFTPLSPDRILDTRAPGIGYTGAKPGAGAVARRTPQRFPQLVTGCR